jgi:FKBP-type peptidyl-prolyl cis-trans isomerase (trigger factor)
MKKLSLIAIQTLLSDLIDDDPTNAAEYGDILAEVTAELNKGMEAKAANDAVYEQAKSVVMKVLDKLTAPAPLSEIYAEAEAALPEGFTKGKFQYAMTRLWADEIIKTEGKPNTYRKA